jgi:hypothetical protein
MISNKSYRVFLLVLVSAIVFAVAPSVFCQEQSTTTRASVRADDDTNLETQLYLILATNREIEEGKIPAALDPIIKRLRESLPFKHYSVAGTFLNRVKNNGRLDVSWVGSPFLLSSASSAAALSNPSFNQFAAVVRLATDGSGNDIVRMNEFKFGARVPVITGQVATTNASLAAAFPVSQVVYESVGLHTDISMREGSPVIAGTLHVGPQGDAIIVAIAARRAN